MILEIFSWIPLLFRAEFDGILLSRSLKQPKIYSPEHKSCDPVFFPMSSQDPELCLLMVTASKAALNLEFLKSFSLFVSVRSSRTASLIICSIICVRKMLSMHSRNLLKCFWPLCCLCNNPFCRACELEVSFSCLKKASFTSSS